MKEYTSSEHLKTHEYIVINKICESSHTSRQIIYTKDEEGNVEYCVVYQDASKNTFKTAVDIKSKAIQPIAKIRNVIKPVIYKILYDIFCGTIEKLIVDWVIKLFEQYL